MPPAERTSPRTVWMTSAEWAKVQAQPKGWIRSIIRETDTEPDNPT